MQPPPVPPVERVLLTLPALWSLWSYRQAARKYRALPVVAGAEPTDGPGMPASPDAEQQILALSVIIPARNEERTLPVLLASLAAQQIRAAEVIVVDDQSEDRTAAIAWDAGATVVHSPGPPAGWTGKTYACHLGADTAKHPWLLFLDADTSLAPDALHRALAYAEQHALEGLSLLLQQQCLGFWERLLLPYAYALYFAGVRSALPVANGQWILLRRTAYERCGGHEAVKGSVIDDVALAQRCRAAGVRLLLARGEALAQVRMYDGLGAIWQGFGKNAFRFVAADPAGGLVTGLSAVTATTLPLLIWNAARRRGRFRRLSALVTYLVGAHGLLFWQRTFRAGTLGAPLYPVSAMVFQALALQSAVRTLLRRGASWKGRSYP